jgi:hypothetical protein
VFIIWFFFLDSVHRLYYTYWFMYVEPPLHPCNLHDNGL